MADLQVIYDSQLEIAAIVNVDERVAWGPAMIGPDAATLLQSFIRSTPFDVPLMTTYDALKAFEQFHESQPPPKPISQPASDQSSPEPVGDSTVAQEHA